VDYSMSTGSKATKAIQLCSASKCRRDGGATLAGDDGRPRKAACPGARRRASDRNWKNKVGRWGSSPTYYLRTTFFDLPFLENQIWQ
jgi:hypothetical protein